MSWLVDLMEATDESESPKSFVFWAGLTAISAVVKNKVYLDKFYYKLYPNIYVLLVAKSGLRKTFPVSLAKSLVERVGNTRVIAGRNSIQAIIQELSRSYIAHGKPVMDSCGFLASGEFSNLIIDDPAAMTILTDLYDGHYNKDWTNTLKGSGKEKLKDINVTLLGATNPSHFKDKISMRDIEGGFIARTLVISETKKSRVNPLTDPPKVAMDLDKLAQALVPISQASGEFKWHPDAKKHYEDWYVEFNEESEREDKTGIANRLHDHVLKIAMLLALSRSTVLELTEADIKQAIEACLAFSTNITKMTMGAGKSQLAPQTASVIEILLVSPNRKLSRQKLLQKVWGDIDHFDLDKIAEHLREAKIIEIQRAGHEIIYALRDEFVEKYLEFKRKKRA
jgi:signal transduction histidine kinase